MVRLVIEILAYEQKKLKLISLKEIAAFCQLTYRKVLVILES